MTLKIRAMLKVKKTPNFRRMKGRITKTEKSVVLMASGIIIEIKNRTLSGRDKDGRSFKRYTPSYKVKKADEFGSTRPNLFATGNMFKAMQSKPIRNGVKLFFNVNAERLKAYYNQNINGRNFWGLSKAQHKKIMGKLRAVYRKT